MLRLTDQHRALIAVRRTFHFNRVEPNRLRTEPTRSVSGSCLTLRTYTNPKEPQDPWFYSICFCLWRHEDKRVLWTLWRSKLFNNMWYMWMDVRKDEKRDGIQTGLRQFVKCPHQWPKDPRYLRVPHTQLTPDRVDEVFTWRSLRSTLPMEYLSLLDMTFFMLWKCWMTVHFDIKFKFS